MSVLHDEVELEDFEYDPENDVLSYPCPCGDVFEISPDELFEGKEIAECNSCSLCVKVIYNPITLPDILERLTNKTFEPKKTLKATN